MRKKDRFIALFEIPPAIAPHVSIFAEAVALNEGCRCGEKKLKITDGLGCDMIGLTVV